MNRGASMAMELRAERNRLADTLSRFEKQRRHREEQAGLDLMEELRDEQRAAMTARTEELRQSRADVKRRREEEKRAQEAQAQMLWDEQQQRQQYSGHPTVPKGNEALPPLEALAQEDNQRRNEVKKRQLVDQSKSETWRATRLDSAFEDLE